MKAKLYILKNVTANSPITDCNTNIIVYLLVYFSSQYQFISRSRLLPSARVGGRHNGQNPDENVDRVHVYSNRPGGKHNFFSSHFWSRFLVLIPTFVLVLTRAVFNRVVKPKPK